MGVRGPKSAGVTLADITPEALAQEVEQALYKRIQALALALEPAYSFLISHKEAARTRAGKACERLLVFATAGGKIEIEHFHTLCVALYATPEGDVSLPALITRASPNTLYGVVLRAAYARYQIIAGEDVTGGQLAALSGLSVHGLRHLRDVGEITFAQRDTITAWEARRFLAARKIAV